MSASSAMRDEPAPQRQPQPVEPKRHDGTILVERSNPMLGIDASVGFTLAKGRVTIFATSGRVSGHSRRQSRHAVRGARSIPPAPQ
jgi:hypothetical protein